MAQISLCFGTALPVSGVFIKIADCLQGRWNRVNAMPGGRCCPEFSSSQVHFSVWREVDISTHLTGRHHPGMAAHGHCPGVIMRLWRPGVEVDRADNRDISRKN